MGRVTSFIMGGLVGACAALALAPRTGAEARAAVAGKATEVKDNVVGMCGQSPQQVYQDVKASASSFAADAAAKGQEVYSQAADKVQGAVNANGGSDELREKIEAARARITEQMMANMGESREAVEAEEAEVVVEADEAEEAVEAVEAVDIDIDIETAEAEEAVEDQE